MFVLIIQSCYDNFTMENIKISKACGLCTGCKNAIDTAIKFSTTENVTLFKEIVHNKNANGKLINLGIKTIDELSSATKDMFLILRAHGEPPETYNYLKSNDIKFSDCTCKTVYKIHELVNQYSSNGYKVIIIGKYGKNNGKMHPEVFGTVGWCKTAPVLIEDEDDIAKISGQHNDKFYLVCQTTFNESHADVLIEKINKICQQNQCELLINKSICYAQKSINMSSVELAKTSDIIIVVGGKNSSNSIELFNNVKQYTKSIFIEDIYAWKEELGRQNIKFDKNTNFGITAGASTLKEELLELQTLIETELKKKD